jgi:outer membrane protein
MRAAVVGVLVGAVGLWPGWTDAAPPRNLNLEEAVALAQAQNSDIAVARLKVEAARGGIVEARSGYLPGVVSTGLAREREHQSDSRLRDTDYNASLRVIESVYTGGAVQSQLAIARLNLRKAELELEAVTNRVAMDVRVAFNETLLNRARIHVREQSVGVLQGEVQTQQERFTAGTVGQLNVRRAEVALANEQPELVDAQTQLQSSYLRLGELFGMAMDEKSGGRGFEVAGQLQYAAPRPDLNECLARADTERPEIKQKEIDVQIEEAQAELDRSALRPQVEAFSGYELYNERDPKVGPEFNHGYMVGVNAHWHIFDGFATKGRLQATQARRAAAVEALRSARLSVASEVRNAFLDIEQSDRVLESETKSVQTADESLEIAKGNLAAGLGTQLDVLQAASDVTRTRTTRLTAIYQHNAALARLARACATSPEGLSFRTRGVTTAKKKAENQVADVAKPPKKLSQR